MRGNILLMCFRFVCVCVRFRGPGEEEQEVCVCVSHLSSLLSLRASLLCLSLLLPSSLPRLLLSFSLRSLLFSLRWLLLGLQVGSLSSLSRWRLLYFLFPPGFSPWCVLLRSLGERDGVSSVCVSGRGEEESGEEEREGEDTEEVRGET